MRTFLTPIVASSTHLINLHILKIPLRTNTLQVNLDGWFFCPFVYLSFAWPIPSLLCITNETEVMQTFQQEEFDSHRP